MKVWWTLVLIGLAAIAVAGEPSIALPLASARRVPADRVAYEAPPNASATVLVKYETGASSVARPQVVLLDDRAVATIEKGEYVTLDVVPAHHVIAVRDAVSRDDPLTIGITAGANGSYYFRISLTSTGSRVFQLSSGPDD
jgi:hypothetical protein